MTSIMPPGNIAQVRKRAEVGWKIYPFPPAFWRRVTVQAIAPQLSYYGPLPQTHCFAQEIVSARMAAAYVYVIQDVEGGVLYVGKTINPVGRLASHRAKKLWWPQPGQLTLLEIEADCRAEADGVALRLEAITIKELRPLHNISGVNW